jgi:sigma-B regulation protein RsbU (phosphoserine phosphatase)
VRPRVLVADDQSDVLEALRFLLKGADLDGDFVTSPAAALERLGQRPYELLLADLNYTRDTTSAGEGLELVSRARTLDPHLPVVVMTGWGTIDTAVEAMRRGARSFVQKPWVNTTLVDILTREIEDGRAARQESVRHEREQQDARAIQRALLPSTLPSNLSCGLAAAWRPAAGYGGDYYDALTFEDESLGLLIADVAGKGLPAALLMSNLQAAFRAFADSGAAAADVVAKVNRLLCRHMVSGRFVTACYLRLDCRSDTLICVNAGHNPPLLVRSSGEVVKLATGGTVLGVFSDVQYEQLELRIAPGDRLVLYTDGITEATDRDGEEYGDVRLADAITARRDLDANALTTALFDDVLAFASGTLNDDATIVSVVVNSEATPQD